MIKTKVNSTLLKNVNRKGIMKVIDSSNVISRVGLKKRLGKNGKTVTNIINSLINDSLIMPVGYSPFTGGRRRELLSINPNFGYLIGIHLDIRFLRGVITDFKYNIIAEEKIAIVSNEPTKSIIQKIKRTLDFLVKNERINTDKILGIGFAANGYYNEKKGEWILSVNNKNWKNVPIREILSKYYDVPIYLENNSRAMALWEKSFGKAKNQKDVVYLNLSTGISSVIIKDGRIYRGVGNNSGEFGHTIVEINGDLCSCGKRGCLETVASGWALTKKARKSIESGVKSEIQDLIDGDINNIEIDIIFSAFHRGDKYATELLESASNYLGVAIANIINLINPELVILGGHFATLGDMFLTRVAEKVKDFAQPLLFDDVEILASAIDDRAAVLGVTTLIRDKYFHIDAIK